MSWNNAPLLTKLTASQRGGKRGAQLWGVDLKGTLHNLSKNAGRPVDRLARPRLDRTSLPRTSLRIGRSATTGRSRAIMGAGHGSAKFGRYREVVARRRLEELGRPGLEQHALATLRFKKVAAAQLSGGPRRAVLGYHGRGRPGINCGEIAPAGNWTPWQNFAKTPDDLPWLEVTACKQGNPKVGALWAIDNKMQLWGMGDNQGGR